MLTAPQLTLEQIRENMLLVGKAVSQLDDLIDKAADARWKFEMLTRLPSLGDNPRGGSVVTSQDLIGNIAVITAQRVEAADILMTLTGAVSIEEARIAYLMVFSAYQRHSQLIELQTLQKAGAPIDAEQLQTIVGVGANTTPEGIAEKLAEALALLLAVAIPVPPPFVAVVEDAPVSISLGGE